MCKDNTVSQCKLKPGHLGISLIARIGSCGDQAAGDDTAFLLLYITSLWVLKGLINDFILTDLVEN